MGGFGSPGTPDLFGHGTLDFEEDDPGEQGAALIPWEEEKAGPRAASRMASSGRYGRQRRAADAFSGRCGGVGDAPPTPRPGKSNVRARHTKGRDVPRCMRVVLVVVEMENGLDGGER
ncbi:hypothetical protein NDU88_007792 [Pleurodeles waltl]|uniref:Uncharacterized protein n=1 Tax=Pleurodeles waltl TaxID=8319 RepID=A0AAV7RRB1_PLEWA|nr:hypothetical protein NDU88_007792 [Pleurodeles waltl]